MPVPSTLRLGLALAMAVPFLVAAPVVPAQGTTWPVELVDPFVGTFVPGFVNPGPALPHGMVGLGPDTEGPAHYGGYNYDNRLITGFSHTHMSAGVHQGGQVPFMPVAGDVSLGDAETTAPVPAYASPFTHAAERAEVGYYSVDLLRYGITAELTATARAGMHRYDFPAGRQSNIVIDISRDLKGRHPSRIELLSDGTVVGSVATTRPSHTVFFAARFDRPVTSVATFSGTSITEGSSATEGDDVGMIVGFGSEGGGVTAKVGISYVDVQGALGNLESEIPGWDFDAVRAAARDAWSEALSRIQVQGGTQTDLVSFYTALYHAQLFPNLFSDVDGRYLGADDVVRTDERPHYTQFSLWDSYRGQNQLLATIDPDLYEDLIASLLDFHRQSGTLPRWQLANRDPGYMSGDPVIPFVGEGWCRGLVHPSDRRELFNAMLQLSEGHAVYNSLGYEPVRRPGDPVELVEGGPRETGTTLEWGVSNLSLALMADDLHAKSEAGLLAERSMNYRNVLDPETRWIRPRHDDGSWLTPFAPENGYGFQEGTSWQYSWLVPHDLAGLFEGMGGNDEVQRRLDVFFGFPATAAAPIVYPKLQNQATIFGISYRGNQYAPGNEHDLHAPFLYNYAGSPWKTQAVARSVASLFSPTPDGLPGNDDLGAMSGWLVWTMLGIYPVTPGAPVFTIASPVFEQATVGVGDDSFTISAPGSSWANRFVQSASLGGETLDRTWMTHDDLLRAGTLDVELGALPDTEWGSSSQAAPPSLSTHGLDAFGCRSVGAPPRKAAG